jgi:hypothetical protein
MSKLSHFQATGADPARNRSDANPGDALSDADLDIVAGGRSCIDWMVDGEPVKICIKPK